MDVRRYTLYGTPEVCIPLCPRLKPQTVRCEFHQVLAGDYHLVTRTSSRHDRDHDPLDPECAGGSAHGACRAGKRRPLSALTLSH